MDLSRLKKRINNTDERTTQSSTSLHLKRQQPDTSKSGFSGNGGSLVRIKKEKDTSDPKSKIKNPRQPLTGHKFERPNTRRARYVNEIEHLSSRSSTPAHNIETGNPNQLEINNTDQGRNNDLRNLNNDSSTSSKPLESTSPNDDLVAVKVGSQQDVSGNLDVSRNPDVSENQDVESESTCAIESSETDLADASSAMPSTPEENYYGEDVFHDALENPIPLHVTDTAQPSTTISIPDQIAVVEASPSKRVAFSPYKQESRFSTPNNSSTAKLKSILKPVPLRIEGGDLVRSDLDTSSVYPDDSISKKGDPTNNQTPDGFFVKAAIASLESGDPQCWASIYVDLQLKFRAGDDKLYLDEAREYIRTFAACLMRDLEPDNPPSLTQAALKCTSYFFYNQSIVTMFSKNETETMISQILNLINSTAEKPTCSLAIWSFSTAKIPPKILGPFVPQMMKAFIENLDSRFRSSSIASESLSAIFNLFVQLPAEIVNYVQDWYAPVIMKLVSNVPGIRSRALELLTTVIPKLIEKEDSRKVLAINKFMKDHSREFLETLKKNFLDDGDEVYAITVWGVIVTLTGRALQKHAELNPMLKIAETCFNSSAQKRTESKMATFQAWTRLIYNFAIGGHIASEKPLRLIMTPIKNCFLSERHKRVRLTCTTTWISLIYALGPKLTKNAGQVLFPILKLAVSDDSEHVRDLALRLLVALFSNTGGQELVDGRSNIVPGTITFADLGLTEATWVRTELLDSGLDCIFRTICLQHKIADVGRERWKNLDLTNLPLLTQQCARSWDGIVRAIRDINLQEKGMKATPEAEQAVSSLLYFVDKVSRCDPKALIPGEWPISDPEKINHLKSDPKVSGFIVRADITNFLLVRIVENFTARALVTTRYRVKDITHADLYDVFNGLDSEASQEKNPALERLKVREITLSPLEFILKSWLVTGESVIQTVLEDQFWLATAVFVELITKGIGALRHLYKCLDHMEDIITKRFTASDKIWPSYSTRPLESNVFRIFQCKYWAIVAQRIGSTIEKSNEITDDVTLQDEYRHYEFFNIMTHPFYILKELPEPQQELIDMDHSQGVHGSQVIQDKVQFISLFNETLRAAWTGLARSFYKVAQQKYNSGNSAMNTLASRIKSINDKSPLPFVWIQSLSISMASAITETITLIDINSNFHKLPSHGGMYSQTLNNSHGKEAFDDLLGLCCHLFEEAYTNFDMVMDQGDTTHIPPVQESAFLLMEKIINKAPPTYTVHWLSKLQRSIVQWVDDPQMKISRLPKASRRLYRDRVDTLWSKCVLRRLLDSSNDSKVGGPKSAFGSVLPPPITTIRGAVQTGANIAADGRSSPSRLAMPTPFLVNGGASANVSSDGTIEVFDSGTLSLLTPLLFAGLNSHFKSMVNSTLEFWNKSFGLSKNLDYPDEIVTVMQQLKLVAIISLPGWSIEDSSQTEVPQFASLSQEQFSLPSELKVKSGLSRLLKGKAEIARQLSPKKRLKRMRMLGLDTPITATSVVTALDSGSSSNYSSASNSRATSPSPRNTLNNTGKHDSAPSCDVPPFEVHNPNGSPEKRDDEMEPESGELRKRRKVDSRTVSSEHTEPVLNMTKELQSFNIQESVSKTPEDSDDDASEVSSPSKRAKLMSDRRGDMKIRQITSVIDWNQSPADGSLASGNNTPLNDLQGDAFSIMPAQPVAPSPTEDTAMGSNGDQNFKVNAGKDTATDAVVINTDLYEPIGDIEIHDTANNINHEVVEIADSETPSNISVDSDSHSLVSTSTSKSEHSAITSKRDFVASMQRLVEAREFISHMDPSQLLELQTQLMALNQSVHGVWGQFVADQQENRNGDKAT